MEGQGQEGLERYGQLPFLGGHPPTQTLGPHKDLFKTANTDTFRYKHYVRITVFIYSDDKSPLTHSPSSEAARRQGPGSLDKPQVASQQLYPQRAVSQGAAAGSPRRRSPQAPTKRALFPTEHCGIGAALCWRQESQESQG